MLKALRKQDVMAVMISLGDISILIILEQIGKLESHSGLWERGAWEKSLGFLQFSAILGYKMSLTGRC